MYSGIPLSRTPSTGTAENVQISEIALIIILFIATLDGERT